MQDGSSQEATQLELLMNETKTLSKGLKQRIAALNYPATTAQEAQIRRNQVCEIKATE